MSLEATLQRTNELLETLLTRLSTANEAVQELGEPELKKTRGRKPKEEVAPVVETVATRYWVIEKHNTVYEQKEGDPACLVEGAVEVSQDIYEQKKAEFAQKVSEAIAANTSKPDGMTAAQAQEALHGHLNKPAVTQSEDVPFEKIVEKMIALNKSDNPAHGAKAVRAILVKYLPNDEKPTVPKLKDLGRNAEILADVLSVLEPAATEEVDLFA